jgi:CheY-like chemotaxis protein
LSDLGLLIEMMSDRHINLYLAFDGKDGIDKAGIIKPDLILLDVRMPILDGFATCRLLKADSNTRHIGVSTLFRTRNQIFSRSLACCLLCCS